MTQPFYHVAVFGVGDDSVPEVNLFTTYDIETAYVHAAFAIKTTKIKGFVIGLRDDSHFELIEKYIPSGGPDRFTLRFDGPVANILFDKELLI